MKKKRKIKKKNRVSLAALVERMKPRVYPVNSRPYAPFVVSMPGEKKPSALPWPKTKIENAFIKTPISDWRIGWAT